jgi:hypothetical protein
LITTHGGTNQSGIQLKEKPQASILGFNYEKLRELVGVKTYDQAKQYHKGWVEEYLGDGNNHRDEKWTQSVTACPVKCFSLFNWGW